MKMIEKVTDEVMDGNNELEKKLNAYLTKTFILTHDVPSDECIDEARYIIQMIKEWYKI